MASAERSANGNLVRGTISLFLRANKFRVELYDGQLVDAVLRDELIEIIRPYYVDAPLVERIGVLVELRQPPAIHRIVEFGGNHFCGAPRVPRR